MVIRSITPFSGNTRRILFEGEETVGFLLPNIVAQFQLSPGLDISDEIWEKIQQADIAARAYKKAVALLEIHAYTYRGMFRRLTRHFPEDACYDAINRLAEEGWINDSAFAEEAARHYVLSKRFGIQRAKREMISKGLLSEQIDEALAPYDNDDIAAENLAYLITRKYFHYFSDPSDQATIRRGKSALYQFGYTVEQIESALRNYYREIPENEKKEQYHGD